MPENWEELKKAADQDILDKIQELEDRAHNLRTFLEILPGLLETTPDDQEVDKHVLFRAANFFGDLDDLPHLDEILINWPMVRGKPGEGYW